VKQKRHEVTLVVRMDTKCTKAQAVRDTVHGTVYPYTEYDYSSRTEIDFTKPLGPEEFDVVTVKSRPSKTRYR